MNDLDLQHVRAEFPALGGDTVFLDNAGGSQVLARVADRVRDYLLSSSVQLGASYPASQAAGEKVLAARRAVAELVNAPHDDEIVMGPATTALMFMLAQALRPGIRPGDEIIVTDTDHEANIGAWTRLAEVGAVVRVWAVNRQTLELDLDELDRLLTPKCRWLAMTWASNILGTVNPVAEVARRVHAVGGRVCVDAVAYAPHRLVDVQASAADVVAFSFYKVFGPHYALMWVQRDLLRSLPSLNHYFIGPDVMPYKLQPGNVNYELSYGCIGIRDYLVDTGSALGAQGTARQRMQAAFDAFKRHEDGLAERLLGWLRDRPGVQVIGRRHTNQGAQAHGRVPTISFTVAGKSPEAIVRQVDAAGIGIRHGDFYARRLMDALGLAQTGGVVRVSIAHYNTAAEIDRLIGCLDRALA